jgi:hypothetical protein
VQQFLWRGALLISLSLSIVLRPAGAQAPQLPQPQIAGRVVRADNGLPIAGATVRLEPAWAAESNEQFQSAETDSRGNYRFQEAVPDNTYHIVASAEGYVSLTYSRDSTLEGVFQHVDASTRLRGIDFALKREAVIRGVLIDPQGKSASAGIWVAAIRKEKRENGSERMLPVATTQTDASGQFVLPKLDSGTYFVYVNGPNGLNARPNNGGWYREAWYSTADAAEGPTPLSLSEGEERNDIRIIVEREPRYNVIIWPTGPEGELTPERYQVHIEGRSHTSTHRQGGPYLIPGIPPGHYKLVTVAWTKSMYQGAGEITFDLTDHDVTLHVAVAGLAEIQGVAKSDDPHDPHPMGVMIGIDSNVAAQGSNVDEAGHFQFQRILPGEYKFKLIKAPDGVALHGVRCRGAEVSSGSPLVIAGEQKITDCEVLLGHELVETGKSVH